MLISIIFRSYCLKVFFLYLIMFKIHGQETLIAQGSTWSYFDNGGLSSTWKSQGFDFSGWANGQAELGYGDGDEITTVGFGGNNQNKHITTYFRKNITLTGNISLLNAQIKFDDACIVYFNGVEVFRDNLPSGTISNSTLASTSVDNRTISFTIPINLIIPNAINEFAIEVHQNSVSSSDLSFDFSLNAEITQPPGLYINEFMASNTSVILPNSENDDWIEIRNTFPTAVDLSGFYITDKLNNPTKYRLPLNSNDLIIPPFGYLVLICSDEPNLGANHIVLGLSANGESIGLFEPDGITLVDTLSFGNQLANVSRGRERNNIDSWKYFKVPSPGAANDITLLYEEILPSPSVSVEGGIFNSNQIVQISTDIPDATILYTLDGSEPDPLNIGGNTFSYKNEKNGSFLTEMIETKIYAAPVIIGNRSSEPNKLSLKSSSYINNGSNAYFPTQSVNKGTVLKAIAYKPNSLSEIITNSYFIFTSPNPYSMPITSISLSEKELFDYNVGIYTPGITANNPGYCYPGNYNNGWRKIANFEYFNEQERVENRQVEIAIHGGCSRGNPRKSIRVYGGDDFEHAFFEDYPERFHRNIILRSSGNDYDRKLFRDAANQKIMDNLNFGKQESHPSILFLNGEYWGIHNVRERQDEHYLNLLYDVDKDSIDIIENSYGNYSKQEGDMVAFNALKQFVDQNSLTSSTNFQTISELIDIGNFIDYHIANIYLANFDWPQNNVRLWRKKSENSSDLTGFNDGKWRWLLYDTDLSHQDYFQNINVIMSNTTEHTLLFRKLMENSLFKNKFISRYADLLNTNFTSQRTTGIINDFAQIYSVEIQEHGDRWTGLPTSQLWTSGITEMNGFFNGRANTQFSQLRDRFNLGTIRNLQLDVSSNNAGYIKVNSVDIKSTTPGVSSTAYPWSGKYFQNLSVILQAINYTGYIFSHWESNGVFISDNESITVTLTSDKQYKAVYETAILSENPFPQAFNLSECSKYFLGWSNASSEGTYPNNMAFYGLEKVINSSNGEPGLSDTLGDLVTGKYNFTSKTRINGLGTNGISFINTGSANNGYPEGKLGALVLALNTQNVNQAKLSFKVGTILPNSRSYAIRLQYRIGDLSPFQDFLDGNGQPVEYQRNLTAGNEQLFENLTLPTELLNQAYIQLMWRYYFYGNETSGARSELKIDDIKVNVHKTITNPEETVNIDKVAKITSSIPIVTPINVHYKAIEAIQLQPGFTVNANSGVFLASIDNSCLE